MTEKDLICLMAAILWPHVNAEHSPLSDEQLAITIASKIVAEVDCQFAQREPRRPPTG